MSAVLKTQQMDWSKYTIDGWLEQFGAWCETVRMKGGDLPDGLHINQIYWLIKSAEDKPSKNKSHVICVITDFEADQVRLLIKDISETKTICASAKVAVNLFIQKNIRGLSLRCMAVEFRLGKTYLDQMIFAGKYYLNGHNKKLRLE